MRRLQKSIGAVSAPFDSYLLARSIKTLPIRAIQHGLSALKIAAFLEAHPLVEKVLYPGLKSHVHHQRVRDALAPAVWKDLESRKGWEADGVPFGGTLSFRPKGGKEAGSSPSLSRRLVRAVSHRP
jgi:cystathionine gamma-lyase